MIIFVLVTNNVVEEIYPSEAITELERNQSSDTCSSGSVQEYSELVNNSSRYYSSGDWSDGSNNSSRYYSSGDLSDESINSITGDWSGTVQVLIDEEQQLINTTAPTHEKKDNADTVIEHPKIVVTPASPTLEASKIAKCQNLEESFFDSVVPCYSKALRFTDILNESVPVSDLNDSTNQHNLDDDSVVYMLENTPVLNRTKSFSSTMDNSFSPQLENAVICCINLGINEK